MKEKETKTQTSAGKMDRRKFLKGSAAMLAGAMIIPSGANAGPIIPKIDPGLKQIPLDIDPRDGSSQKPDGGREDEYKIPHGTTPDDPPGLGPYLQMKPPGYNPSNSQGTLYAMRFLKSWSPSEREWFGPAQLHAMVRPKTSWLNALETNSEARTVVTIWNIGNQTSYGVLMRALCFAVCQTGQKKWQEVCRQDLGYVCIDKLTPGDYVEVVYPSETVQEGLSRVNHTLAEKVRAGKRFEKLYFFHKCFVFDPVTDPINLSFPFVVEGNTPLKGKIGGRHGAGWVWWWGDYESPTVYFP